MVRNRKKNIKALPDNDSASKQPSQTPPTAPTKNTINIPIAKSKKRKFVGMRSNNKRSKIQLPPPFSVMKLPLEIRLKIFNIYFHLDNPSECDEDCPPLDIRPCYYHKSGSSCILYVSKQVHSEVWPIYARYRSFTFRELIILKVDFLDVQRIPYAHWIKHITIHNNLEYGHERFIDRLQDIWWEYLDTFSRLETLTFEAHNHGAWRPHEMPSFYELIPVLLQLQEGGSAQRIATHGSNAHIDLPKSHQWALHIGGITIDAKNKNTRVNSMGYHKIILQRHTAEFSQSPDLLSKRIKDKKLDIEARALSDETVVFCNQPVYLSVVDRSARTYGLSAFHRLACQQFAEFTLGKKSRLLNNVCGSIQRLRHLTGPANFISDEDLFKLDEWKQIEIVTIVGQWE